MSGIRTDLGAALIFSVAALAASFAHAADYVSVAENGAIFYDAPSLKAKKLFVASRYLPLEQVIILDNWVKVRDSSGSLSWIEQRSLSSKRYVTVTAELAALRQAPEDSAALTARIKQQVALEWQEDTGAGWLKVRHPDGITGYVRSTEVWGN